MERKTFKILFLIKKSRTTKDGKVPILMRVTVNGFRMEITTNLKIDPDKWNALAERSIGNSREDDEINFNLDTNRLRIMQIHRQLELDGDFVDVKRILEVYQGKDQKPKPMLLDLFKEHNDKCKMLSGKDMSEGTIERYEVCYRHTKAFLTKVYQVEDIPLEDINHKFITDYEFYLKTERNCSHNSTTKYLKNFKKIIRIALANDLITKDPFANIRFSLEDIDPVFLLQEEVISIHKKEITNPRLSHIRDIFVFCCLTGLAFSDVKQLKSEHICQDKDGKKWIRKSRQKTKNACDIPLADLAIEILSKYDGCPDCTNGQLLPVKSNQKMNNYLKELATICCIDKEITSHVARHSFATMALANGVSMENVAKMLGHSDTKMTRHYARVLDSSIKRDMEVINNIFNKI